MHNKQSGMNADSRVQHGLEFEIMVVQHHYIRERENDTDKNQGA